MDDRRDKCIAHATEARNKVSRCLESGARVDDRVAAMVNRLQLLSTRMAAYAREVTHWHATAQRERRAPPTRIRVGRWCPLHGL